MFHSRFQNTTPYNLTNRRLTTEKRQKRRGVSPKLYPRKLLITEEKVAADLCNLCINEKWQRNQHQTKLRRNSYRQRTVSEIEEGLELSSDEETQTNDIKITISDEFRKQIKTFKHDLLVKQTSQDLKLPPTVKPDYSMAVVLWKPPNGIVPDLIKHLPPDVTTNNTEIPNTDKMIENKMMLEEQCTENSFSRLHSEHQMPYQNSPNWQNNFFSSKQFDLLHNNELDEDMMEL